MPPTPLPLQSTKVQHIRDTVALPSATLSSAMLNILRLRPVRLWNPATNQPTAILHGHTGRVNGVAFSPDGRQPASASFDHTVRLWDPASSQLTSILEGHAEPVRGVAFSPDGRQLASAINDRTVRLWDAANGQLIVTLEGHTDWVRGWRSRPTAASSPAPSTTAPCASGTLTVRRRSRN